MIRAYQFNDLPAALVLWVIVYLCDYFLTIHGNSLRLKYAKDHIGMDGSYELNPYYQKDIDTNNRLSRRFILMLVLFIVWLILMWYCANILKVPEVFSAATGYLILMELPILERHIQNISQFNAMKTPGAVVGYITYARWIQLALVGHIFGYWLIAYLLLFLLTGSWLFIGGSVAMLGLVIRYSSRGQRLRDRSPAVQLPKDAPPLTVEPTTNARAS